MMIEMTGSGVQREMRPTRRGDVTANRPGDDAEARSSSQPGGLNFFFLFLMLWTETNCP